MGNALTPKEKEILSMLKKINDDETFLIISILAAAEEGKTDALYDFLKDNPDVDDDEVYDFIVPGDAGLDTEES